MARKRVQKRRDVAKKADLPAGTLRIIGGRFRGRPIRYLGDPRTRPMKQRVREAAFNLIGRRATGAHVIDLFAGTGALAWEAFSRGAESATLIERHFPTARMIRENAASLGLRDQISLVPGDTFIWSQKLAEPAVTLPRSRPWLVFCSPPYELYVSHLDQMLVMIQKLANMAPADSLVIVESDERFDTQCLPDVLTWDVRNYPPAVLATGRRA